MKLGMVDMDKNKALMFLENSFLEPLLKREEITDISFNGECIYYVDNLHGRQKYDEHIDEKNVRDFLRQISNLSEQQFSYISPILDVSFGRYRINATHQSVSKKNNDGVVNFSLRIASEKIRITDDSDFLTAYLVRLMTFLIRHRISIVIGGATSSGKTEFQKYLINKVKFNERLIIIDNVHELDMQSNQDADFSYWQVNENNPNTSIETLIRNALRNNPDWLIIAESRGKEMVDILDSALTGLPIITTMHSYDVFSLPSRMARMVISGNKNLEYKDVLADINYHFHFYVYLTKEDNGIIKRYISDVVFINNDGKPYRIYQRYKNKHFYYRPPKELLERFDDFPLLEKEEYE